MKEEGTAKKEAQRGKNENRARAEPRYRQAQS